MFDCVLDLLPSASQIDILWSFFVLKMLPFHFGERHVPSEM